jgi:hypothetical protein
VEIGFQDFDAGIAIMVFEIEDLIFTEVLEGFLLLRRELVTPTSGVLN